ncbi:MAG: isoprenylcysteine carboxylmethyltransferase family protein [Acidobacteria bacterium]|nr:isoprenylcysteine carboxylmethyltransferase family protein [Acidobacteriota bacterium]
MPPFHRIFVALFFSLFALRLIFHVRARVWQRGQLTPEPWLAWIRGLVALPLFVVVGIYVFRPEVLAWADLPLPASLRWVGTAFSLLALGLLLWVHVTLDRNFSGDLRIRRGHTLVTTGPYRYVRHPMYSAFFLLLFGFLLLTANGFLGGVGLAMMGLVAALRTAREEQMLRDAFGDEYRQYAARTGRLLPRW